MSETSTPTSPPTSAPAPAQSDLFTPTPSAPSAPGNIGPKEVEIAPSQTTIPTPVGSQAPEKGPAELRREAIQKAFDKASKGEPEKPKAKAAEAKPGHNNPPEPMEKTKVEAKIEAKTVAREREPTGQFKRGQNTALSSAPDEGAPGDLGQLGQPQSTAVKAELPPDAPFREAPRRWSEKARAEWAATPESIRGDVYRMAEEFDGAYKQYRGDHEAMEPIRQYHEMAKQGGTTLDKALHNYVNMEQMLRQDPLRGLDVIVSNLNLRTQDGQKLTLRDIAHHVVTQSPEQLQIMQSSNAQMAQTYQLQATQQRIQALEQQIQKMEYERQFAQTRQTVDQFAETHPLFDKVGDVIEEELAKGYDLETAYDRAVRLSGHAAQTRNTPAQTRPIDRSISGAPDVGPSNGTSRRSGKPVGRREAIQNAINRVNGAL